MQIEMFLRKGLCPGGQSLFSGFPTRGRCRFWQSCRWKSEARNGEGGLNYDQLVVNKQQQIQTYLKCLLDKNKVMNLTAIDTMKEAIDRHVNDSLAIIPVIKDRCNSDKDDLRVIDVGSGAGLPGVILAVQKEKWKVVLLDALKKRCDFVDTAAAQSGIKNVQTEWARAEDAGRKPEHREMYDVSVVRAVAELRVLVEYCLPFLKVGGILVAAKGPVVQDEIFAAENAVKMLGGELVGSFRVNSFSADGQRNAIVVRKSRTCPDKFPRRPGMPSKRPL